MIIRPQIQNFSNDIMQQHAALSDVRHAIQQWKNGEIGKAQRAYILKAGGAATAQNCSKHLKPLFENHAWLYEMIEQMCHVQGNNPFANIELRSSNSENYSSMILHQERKFAIHLCIAKSNEQQSLQNSFVFGPDMMMLAPLGDAQIVKAQLDEHDKLCGAQTLLCNDSDVFIYDSRRQSMNIKPLDSDIIFLRAIIKKGAFDDGADTISHHYLRYEGDNGPQKHLADETLSRAQLIFSVLRHQQNVKSIPLFQLWVRNDVPDMRWYVMREFLALDMEAALPHLLFMSEYDDSRCVRKAALDTVHIIKTQHPDILNALSSR